MGEMNQNPAAGAAPVTVIGTSPSGSKALVAFAGIAWAAWIGFLIFILMTRV